MARAGRFYPEKGVISHYPWAVYRLTLLVRAPVTLLAPPHSFLSLPGPWNAPNGLLVVSRSEKRTQEKGMLLMTGRFTSAMRSLVTHKYALVGAILLLLCACASAFVGALSNARVQETAGSITSLGGTYATFRTTTGLSRNPLIRRVEADLQQERTRLLQMHTSHHSAPQP